MTKPIDEATLKSPDDTAPAIQLDSLLRKDRRDDLDSHPFFEWDLEEQEYHTDSREADRLLQRFIFGVTIAAGLVAIITIALS